MASNYTSIKPGRSFSRSLSTSAKEAVQDVTIESHGRDLLSGMYEAYQEGRFCDVTLKVPPLELKAHKLVLVSLSEYFRAMLTDGLKESGQSEIEFQDLDSTMTRILVDFAYTGKIRITGENVQELLVTANFLGITSVIEACCKFIEERIDKENCIEILHFADGYGLAGLFQRDVDFIAGHMLDFENDPVLNDLPYNVLSAIISSEKMVMKVGDKIVWPDAQEQRLFNVVLRYIHHAPEERKQFLPKLLAGPVRLPLMSNKQLSEVESVVKIMGEECLSLFSKARRLKEKPMDPENKWYYPRLSTSKLKTPHMHFNYTVPLDMWVEFNCIKLYDLFGLSLSDHGYLTVNIF